MRKFKSTKNRLFKVRKRKIYYYSIVNYFDVSWDQRKSTCNTDCYRSEIKRYFTSWGKLEISVAERTEMDIEVPFYLICRPQKKTFLKMKSESRKCFGRGRLKSFKSYHGSIEE